MCGVCGNYFTVEANGDIYPCDFYCKEEYNLGNIAEENPFGESEKRKKFVDESLIIHEKCKGCKYYNLCRGGCRRDRINSLSENKYCKAYYNFFEYSADRLIKVVTELDR